MNLDAHERRFALTQAEKAVPVQLRQRQDSLDAQLVTLQTMALRAGCHDAADWLDKVLKTKIGEERMVP